MENSPSYFRMTASVSLAWIILFLFFFCVSVGILYSLLIYNELLLNWNVEKCKTGIFIGGESNLQNCMQSNLKEIVAKSTSSLSYGSILMTQLFIQMGGDVNNIRFMMDRIRNSLANITQNILQRVSNVTVPIQQVFVTLKDMFAKMQGVFATTLFTAVTVVLTMKSILVTILLFVIIILITLAALIIVMWIFPFSWAVAATFTAIFVSISIPLAIFLNTVGKVVGIAGLPKLPKTPHVCFHPHSPIDIIVNHSDNTKTFIKEKNKKSNPFISQKVSETIIIPNETNEKCYLFSYFCKPLHFFFSSFMNLKNISFSSQPLPQSSLFIKEKEKKYYYEDDSPIHVLFDLETHGSTMMNDVISVKINDVQLGDELPVPEFLVNHIDTNKVIATFRLLLLPGVKLYELGQNIVTGSHLVFSYELDQWIPVSQHRDAIPFTNTFYPKSNTLCCINTSSGYIEHDDHIFTDWDEMLPNDFDLKSENEMIQLSDSSFVRAKDIKLGDILFESNEMIIGIVTTSFLFYSQNKIKTNKIQVANISKEHIQNTLAYHFYTQDNY